MTIAPAPVGAQDRQPQAGPGSPTIVAIWTLSPASLPTLHCIVDYLSQFARAWPAAMEGMLRSLPHAAVIQSRIVQRTHSATWHIATQMSITEDVLMKFFTSLYKAVAAATLALSATAASATDGPFYNCIKKDLVVFDGTIVDAAVATPNLSTLVSLVSAAGLVDTLASAENITVFAPTNRAFANIAPEVLSAIGGNPDVLTAVLAYHVVPGTQDPRKWATPVSRTTLGGAPVYMHNAGGQTLVNAARVKCTGVKTNNGIVWLVNSVLLPPN